MKRLRVFPFGDALAAGSRWPLAVFTAGLLALAWSALATAQEAEVRPLTWLSPAIGQAAENRSAVPEPIAAPEGEPAQQSVQLLEPDLPKAPKRTAVARPQADELDPPADDPPAKEPSPHKRSRRAAVVEPPADEQYAEEDDGGCEDRGPCPSRCWAPACCWQPFANRVEARGEWLLWWGKGNYVPPLVTTGPSAPASGLPGALGSTGTVILFGNSDLNDEARSGARVTLDYWLTCDHSLGLEVQYFALGEDMASFQADSNTFPVLARPFFNTQTGVADAGLIGFPGTQTGNVNVSATSNFQGAEVLLRQTWFQACDAHLDFLAGYRYLRLSDDLGIDEFETFINPQGTVPVNSTLALSDRFSSLNEFQGADLGFASDWRCNRWNLGFLLKVGLGNTSSRVSISGSTVATEPTQAPVTSSGGFLAQASNSGQFQRNQLTLVPELGINLGFDLTPRLRLVGGYSLIYWSAVARSGDQIDLNLAPPQFPPQTTASNHFPEFRFAMSDYWAQGLNLGLDFRF